MPVLFIGHGSPMNGIENAICSQTLAAIAEKIPTQKSVLVISAHWLRSLLENYLILDTLKKIK